MAVDYKIQLVTAFSALALAVGVSGVPAHAAKARCTSEECACERALRQNTVEALEEFLRKYPQSVNNKESACAAIAVPPEGAGTDAQSTEGEKQPIESGDSSYGG